MRQKLFTKQIDDMLFKQYAMGNDLSKQKVVAKIYNPYGRGTWYLLNSDPQDPDYLWAIVDLFEAEVGSVSREDLETIKVPPFGLNLERDMYFQPINAKELFDRLNQGEKFADGGMTNNLSIKDKIKLRELNRQIQEELKTIEEFEEDDTETTYDRFGNPSAPSFNQQVVMSAMENLEKLQEERKNLLKGKKYADGGATDVKIVENKEQESYLTSEDATPNEMVVKLAKGGEIGKYYIVEWEMNGEKHTSTYLLYPNDRIENFLPPIAKIISIREKLAKGGMMDNSSLQSLIGMEVEIYSEGVKEPFTEKITDIRVTPPYFTNRDLTIMTKNGGEDVISLKKLDDFLENKEVYLKDSKGEDYAIRLVGSFEPMVVRTQFEEEEFEYAKGGMVVTSIKDIPNFKKRLDEGKVTYRGLGMGKLASDFHKLSGENGTRIKVDGKEYFITNTEFDTFSRGSDGLMRVKFDAPQRKGYADGGMMGISGESNGSWIANDGMGKFADGGIVRMGEYWIVINEGNTEFPYLVNNREGAIVYKAESKEDAMDWVKERSDEYANGGETYIPKHGDKVMFEGNEYVVSKVTNDNVAGFIDTKWYLDSNKIGVKGLVLDTPIGITKMAKGGNVGGEESKEMWMIIDSETKDVVVLQLFLYEYQAEDKIKSLIKVKSLSKYDKLEVIKIFVSKVDYLEYKKIRSDLFDIKGKDNFWKKRSGATSRVSDLETKEKKLLEKIKKYNSNKMAKGGMTSFNDKVKAISKKLLKDKKVSPKVQKDYGKTYNKKEALESAKRIAGAMRKKEMAKKKR